MQLGAARLAAADPVFNQRESEAAARATSDEQRAVKALGPPRGHAAVGALEENGDASVGRLVGERGQAAGEAAARLDVEDEVAAVQGMVEGRHGADGVGVRGEGVGIAGQEAQEDVLAGLPGGAGVDGDAQGMGGFEAEGCLVLEAVLDVGFELGVDEAGEVEGYCGDDVVPGGEDEAAVEEEEDEEDDGEEEVGCFEEFVEAVSKGRLVSCYCGVYDDGGDE